MDKNDFITSTVLRSLTQAHHQPAFGWIKHGKCLLVMFTGKIMNFFEKIWILNVFRCQKKKKNVNKSSYIANRDEQLDQK